MVDGLSKYERIVGIAAWISANLLNMYENAVCVSGLCLSAHGDGLFKPEPGTLYIWFHPAYLGVTARIVNVHLSGSATATGIAQGI